MKTILKILVNAAALYFTVWILRPHIVMQNEAWYAFVFLGLIFGIVNTVIKPIVMFASCPLIILTLGLGTLIVNTLLFLLSGWLGTVINIGFTIPENKFLYAFLGALIVSAVSFILNGILGTNRKNR